MEKELESIFKEIISEMKREHPDVKLDEMQILEIVKSEIQNLELENRSILEEQIENIIWSYDLETVSPETSSENDQNEDNEIEIMQLYLSEINKYEDLSIEEEKILIKAYKINHDGKAKEKLIVHNLKIVPNIAQKYRDCGLPILDIISEGNLGLITAVEQYNTSKGKLSKFATWWIEQAIESAIHHQLNSIKIGLIQRKKLEMYIDKKQKIMQEMGIEGSIKDLSFFLKEKEETIKEYEKLSNITIISLEEPINEEECLIDIFVDEKSKNPEKATIRIMRNNEFNDIFDFLNPKEKYVIALKYRLLSNNQVKITIHQIACELKKRNLSNKVVSDGRIKQLEEKGIKKLKSKMFRTNFPQKYN